MPFGRALFHPALDADQYIEDTILARLSRPDAVDLLPQSNGPKIDYEALHAEMITLEDQKKKAMRLFMADQIDEPMLIEAKETADQRIAEIKAQTKQAAGKSPISDLFDYPTAREWWKSLSQGRKREVVKALAVVTLLPVGRGNRLPIAQRITVQPLRPHPQRPTA